jgi:hypothetical protein
MKAPGEGKIPLLTGPDEEGTAAAKRGRGGQTMRIFRITKFFGL